MELTKQEQEIKEQILPYMYCYLGSGMLTNTHDAEVQDKCADEVIEIIRKVNLKYTQAGGV